MHLTETEYATLLARGTVREIAPEAPRSPREASQVTLEGASGNVGHPDAKNGHILPEPEKRFLDRVRRLALANGFATYHTHRSDRSEQGFVDLVLCDGHSLLLVELKSSTGKLTREQQQWLSLLAHAGVEVAIWRPSDWDRIVDRLTRKVHHADPGQS
jgi:hypothetical protein